jgi:hypothetical protein
MERQEFLKRAGVGSIALSFPALADVAWAHDDDDDDDRRTKFYFVALSGQAATVTGGDSVAMSGCGVFRERWVRGGGEFIHFDGTRFGNRDNVKVTGRWRAKRVLDWDPLELMWGVGQPGILKLAITLFPCDMPPIRDATLEIVCNLAPGGIFNPGTPPPTEGYTLTVPGLAPFRPFSPNIGLTLFTERCPEEEDDDDDDERKKHRRRRGHRK